MLDVVYFVADDGNVVLVGVFLMPSDAEAFIRNTPWRQNYLIQTVSSWKEWSSIKSKITLEEVVIQ
jgi:hypothetical protein